MKQSSIFNGSQERHNESTELPPPCSPSEERKLWKARTGVEGDKIKKKQLVGEDRRDSISSESDHKMQTATAGYRVQLAAPTGQATVHSSGILP